MRRGRRTAYLLCPDSSTSALHRQALDDVASLRAKAESLGSSDFSPLWSGQAAALARAMPAGALTRRLGEETEQLLVAAGAFVQN